MSMFNRFGQKGWPSLASGLIEEKLRHGINILDNPVRDEIQGFLQSRFMPEGGFANRGGVADLYYTLFGFFVAEAAGWYDCRGKVLEFSENQNMPEEQNNIPLFCKAVLIAKIAGVNHRTKQLAKQIKDLLKETESGYTSFWGVVVLYYLKEFFYLSGYLKKIGRGGGTPGDLPCPVIAAQAVLWKMAGKDTQLFAEKLFGFYSGEGGFRATVNAPCADLLSTAVALFALDFCGADLLVIKPSCLDFIDSRYSGGGFTGTRFDLCPDTEYTFYGLLALGSLNK